MQSTNEGNDWDIHQFKASPGGESLIKVIAQDGEVLSIGDHGAIICKDGGEWRKVNGGFSSFLNKVCHVPGDPNLAFAVGSDGTVLRGEVDGDDMTWTKVQGNFAGLALNSISFVDASNGLIVGEKGLAYRTRNGGLSWSKLSLPIKSDLYGIRWINNSEYYLVGAKSTILRFQQSTGVHVQETIDNSTALARLGTIWSCMQLTSAARAWG
jgi:hypothetical protein